MAFSGLSYLIISHPKKVNETDKGATGARPDSKTKLGGSFNNVTGADLSEFLNHVITGLYYLVNGDQSFSHNSKSILTTSLHLWNALLYFSRKHSSHIELQQRPLNVLYEVRLGKALFNGIFELLTWIL